MKVLNYPGGSTKAGQIAVSAIELYKQGYRPNLITCTSAGSIISMAIELGMYSEVLFETKDIELDEMFTVAPTNGDGKFTWAAYRRLAKGLLKFKNNHSFGLQDTRHLIKTHIEEAVYQTYIESLSTPEIIIFTVNPTTGKPRWHKVKEMQMSYEDYVEF